MEPKPQNQHSTELSPTSLQSGQYLRVVAIPDGPQYAVPASQEPQSRSWMDSGWNWVATAATGLVLGIVLTTSVTGYLFPGGQVQALKDRQAQLAKELAVSQAALQAQIAEAERIQNCINGGR